jgi:alpha-1,2-mannosyltransferase
VSAVSAVLAALRTADWLHAGRARGYAGVFLIVTVAVVALRFAVAGTGMAMVGMPFAADFVSFWAAGKLALAGTPALAYDVDAHWAMQGTALPDTAYSAFFYPPVFLLFCAPFGLLGFKAALAAFLALSLLAYALVARALLPRGLVGALGFPAVAVNFFYCQNGFLTTALFGGGVLAAPARPVLAGVLFALLAYKPHLAALVPVALLLARQWRAFAAMAATVAVLCAASLAVFGVETWRAFLAGLPLAQYALQHGLVTNIGWVSTFWELRLWGAGLAACYGAQAIAAAAALAALAVVARRRPDAALGGVLPVAALFATPFVLAYDLVLLAVPMAWLLREARARGFLPWEKIVLAAAYVLPLATLLTAAGLNLSLGPPVLAALLAVITRRASRPA